MEWHDQRAPFSPVDLTSSEFWHAPLAGYATIRAAGPIVWQPQSRGFLLTRYRETAAVLRDPRFLEPDLTTIWRRLQAKLADRSYGDAIDLFAAMPFVHEGPEHAHLRRSLAVAVAPFAGGTPEIDHCISERVKFIRREGAFDVAQDFASHLLFNVMCEMLRVPTEERSEIKPVSTMSWALETTIPISWRDRAAAEIRRARSYLLQHVTKPGVQATSPFVSSAYTAMTAEGAERDVAVATMIAVMIVMGNDALGACITFPVDQLKRGDGAGRVPQGEWEALSDDAIRFAAPVDFINRIASQDTEFAGCALRAGDRLIISPLCANHDPAEFGPAAGTVSAKPAKAATGLTFGAGSHLCVGNRFSRTIVRAAFAALAGLPEFALTGPTVRGPGSIVRTVMTQPAALH